MIIIPFYSWGNWGLGSYGCFGGSAWLWGGESDPEPVLLAISLAPSRMGEDQFVQGPWTCRILSAGLAVGIVASHLPGGVAATPLRQALWGCQNHLLHWQLKQAPLGPGEAGWQAHPAGWRESARPTSCANWLTAELTKILEGVPERGCCKPRWTLVDSREVEWEWCFRDHAFLWIFLLQQENKRCGVGGHGEDSKLNDNVPETSVCALKI